MLKRLSGTFSQSSDQLLLVPPPPISPNLLSFSNSAPSSPHSLYRQGQQGGGGGYPFPPVNNVPPPPPTTTLAQQTIDRSSLHKTLQSISNLLVALDELRSASLIHSKAEKKLGKALKELAISGWSSSTTTGENSKKNIVEKDSTIPDALLASSTMFETFGETDSKFSKLIQHQYEQINDLTNKYFKKTAKEEKNFEDSLSLLDSKVSKATQSYQKYTLKNSTSSSSSSSSAPLLVGTNHLDSLTQSHSNYVQTLQLLQSQTNSLKLEYGIEIHKRREKIGRELARVFSGLSEKNWRNRIEGVRKGGDQVIGKVLTKGVWVGEGFEGVGEFENWGRELNRETATGEEGEEDGEKKNSQPQFKQAQSEQTSSTRRGPRAPSTSTQNTVSTFSTSSTKTSRTEFPQSIPSPIRRSPTALQAVEEHHHQQRQHDLQTTRIDSSPTVSDRRVSIEEPTIRQSRPTSISQDPISPQQQQQQQQQQQTDVGGGRTLPRGWYLDPSFANHLDDQRLSSPPPPPVSPRIDNQTQTQANERPRFGLEMEERRQSYDHSLGSISRREGDGEVLLRKPTPRYGSAPPVSNVGEIDEWGRNNRVVGEELKKRESFVRRMSQKYGSNNQAEISHSPAGGSTNSQSLPSSHNRSNSRVSQLAKRYSSPPEPLLPSEEISQQQRRPLPTPTPRLSSSSQFSLSQQLSSSSPHTRPPPPPPLHPQFSTIPTGSSSTNESHSSHASSEPHPNFCACQTCTSLHYSHNGREELSKAQEERLQKELRLSGGGGKGGGTLRGLVGKGKEVFGRMG
ncbi:hypothetical protein JCM5350_000966 [Sporobolomyces pararoseus]